MKSVNYKVGALKRKFKNGPDDFEPGTFISKSNEQKTLDKQELEALPDKKKVAIIGLV